MVLEGCGGCLRATSRTMLHKSVLEVSHWFDQCDVNKPGHHILSTGAAFIDGTRYVVFR